ncbi:hypothetical protein KKC87_04090 [Patescibacteria group bacterium]|nr:hypothetical protein [Patescibacteria group bacterium]
MNEWIAFGGSVVGGGLGAVIIGFFLNKKLEGVKSNIRIKEKISNYQYKIYTEMWSQLADLQTSVNQLWAKVDNKSIKNFSKQIQSTKEEIERKRIILTEEESTSLQDILAVLENYKLGKRKIVELSTLNRANHNEDINETINANKDSKDRLKNQLDTILKRFKNKLGLE